MDVRKVIVGVDGTRCSDAALDWAVLEAARRGAPLEVLHASTHVELVGAPAFGAPAFEAKVDGPLLRRCVERAGELAPSLVVTTTTVRADPARALTEAGADAALVVVGCHGRGWLGRLLVGSVSHQVVRHPRAPVVVVREDTVMTAGPVVVGVDGSPASDAAVALAAAAAAERGEGLRVVHAWQAAPATGFDALPVSQEVVDAQEAAARSVLAHAGDVALAAAPGLRVERVLAAASPSVLLAQESDGASLVVVGAHGHAGMSGQVVGSVTRACLDAVRCPVVVVPAG
jgi:nucleotide-binding universal stress UspA family protein